MRFAPTRDGCEIIICFKLIVTVFMDSTVSTAVFLAAASSLSLARSDRRERSSETESINGPPYGRDSGVPVKVRKNKS